MSTDPVISSRYGVRPLMDLPALDVASGSSALNPSHLATMAPLVPYRSASEDQSRVRDAQDTEAPRLPLPADWPYAVKLPGSLFAAPPGPLPFKNPQIFPYSFLHLPPFTQHPPSFQITDTSGQLMRAMNLSPERQHLSHLYPGVHDPCPPQGYFTPSGPALPGLGPQRAHHLQGTQVDDAEHVHFEGVLTYGEPSPVHGPDKSSQFWGLPEFLRHELQVTYGHVPATDVRVVALNGEFHVYASPRRIGGGDTVERRHVSTDHRLIMD